MVNYAIEQTPLHPAIPLPSNPPASGPPLPHPICPPSLPRCVIWAELIRSAAASKMEDIVRTAAPYCLDMVWSPGVEREMVMLQAQVSYLEAEACVAALSAQVSSRGRGRG